MQFLPMLDNPGRVVRTDAGEGVERCRIGGVEVHLGDSDERFEPPEYRIGHHVGFRKVCRTIEMPAFFAVVDDRLRLPLAESQALQVVEAHPDLCEVEVVESVPYKEYLSLMSHSHVILDQLYSYTPATNALLGMAHGLVAVSGAEPEYYELIGETENHPIVNVSPLVQGDIEEKLEWIIKNKSQLPALSRASRAFVEKHNAARTVASRYLAFWENL